MTAARPLRCLRGRPVPEAVAADIAVLPRLPIAARLHLYRVLGPSLPEPVPSATAGVIQQFAEEFETETDLLARVVQASRFVLREASITNLSADELAEDLAALGDTGEIASVLLPGYEMVKQVVRAELMRGALADHGKVVERVAWRVDQVLSSNRGDRLNIPVGVLTLWYRDGERLEQVTVQFPPEAQQELREMCVRFG